jgi:hypothetical protein
MADVNVESDKAMRKEHDHLGVCRFKSSLALSGENVAVLLRPTETIPVRALKAAALSK